MSRSTISTFQLFQAFPTEESARLYLESRSAIRTEFIYPPIPTRKFDWRAWFEDTEESGPFGRGKTEQDAIADLLEQI